MPLVDLDPIPTLAQTGDGDMRNAFKPTPALDFNAPVVDYGFHSRDEKPIDPTDARGSLLGAAFRQDNIIGAFMSRKDMGIDNSKEDGFDGWKDIAGTKYEPYWDRFVESNNSRYSEGIKRQIDMELDDRRTLDAAGWRGTLASMGMSIADQTVLLPGGSMVKAVKGGYLVSRSALMVGAAAGLGAAVQEGILQSQQQIRPWEDSAVAVGGSVILGGLLGAAGAALLNKAERKAVESAARVLYGADDAVGSVAGNTGKLAAGSLSGTPVSTGAAAVEKPAREALAVEGRGAQAVVDTLGGLTPNTRLMNSPSAAARRFGDELAETVAYRNMHAEGDTLGPSVETLARVNYNSRIRQSLVDHNDLFKAGRKAGFGMTKVEFEEAIGRALRNGDVGDNDFVTRAAQAWRKNLFDPFKEEAIAARLLPPDVRPEGAVSYFSRVYDRPRLIAGEADFKGRIANYYEPVLQREFAKHAEATRLRLADLEQEASDLRLSADDRVRTLDEVTSRLRDLEARNIDKVERAERIAGLNRTAADAAQRGDRQAAKLAREEAARLKAEGGKEFAAFRQERGALRSRAKRVDMSYAGLEDRQQRVLQQLTDLEESNLRGMSRLVARGRKLEQEAARLDPTVKAEKMAAFRTAFNDVLRKSETALQRIADARAKLMEGAQRAEGQRSVVAATGVQQPARVVSGPAVETQGGVRADSAVRVGTASPQARFGQQAAYQAPTVRLSAPKINEDLGVDIPGTLLRELRGEPASVKAYHGSPHDWAPERLVEMPDGRRVYLEGTGNKLPDVPEGAQVIKDFPNGRARSDKIGTGEGAQAYGYGFYGAEAETVATGYRDALAGPDKVFDAADEALKAYRGASLTDAETRAVLRSNKLLAPLADDDKAVSAFRGLLPEYDPKAAVTGAQLDRYRALNDAIERAAPKGSLYEVRINANPEHFLDWDKPLSQQSETVRKILDRLGVTSPKSEFRWNGYSGGIGISAGDGTTRNFATFIDVGGGQGVKAKVLGQELGTFPNIEAAKAAADAELKARNVVPEATGANAYGIIAGSRPDSIGAVSNPDAARVLREAGIPGIKYLDAGSRNNAGWKIMPPEETVSGKYVVSQFGGANAQKFDTEAAARAFLAEQEAKASRNYVVFDDALIQVTSKDGKPVPINDYLKGEAIGRLEVTPELRADLMPPTGMTSDAASILRAAMDGNPATVADLEAAIARAAQDSAPPGMRVKASSVDAITAVLRKAADRPTDNGKPLSLLQYIVRNGGLKADAETAARNLDDYVVPGYGKLVRKDGKDIDGFFRNALAEDGYIRFDADGTATRDVTNEFFSLIDTEVRGKKVYSILDQDAVEALSAKTAARNAGDEFAYRVEQRSAEIVAELEDLGIAARDVDQGALTRAAEAMVNGDVTDPLMLYERAIMEAGNEAEAARLTRQDELISGAGDVAKKQRPVDADVQARREQAFAVRLAREAKAEAARVERLNSIARRMENLEAFDPEERLYELKRITDDLAREVSDRSMAKGEKAAMLKQRYQQFDPERIRTREDNIARMRADAERQFFDRWEVKRGGENVDLYDPKNVNFRAYAEQIADDVYDKIMGKDTAGVAAADFITPLKSGPLKERTFNVPDKLIEDFLDSNVTSVGERYGRSMAAQIEMTRRFGRADMQEQLREVADEFRAMREAVQKATTPQDAYAIVGKDPSMLDGLRAWMRGVPQDKVTKERVLQYLHDAEKANMEDLSAMRDMILHRYLLAENSGDYARMVRNAMAFNYIRVMGGSGVINAISEVYRPAMVHGLKRFMGDGIAPLLKNLDAVKMSVHEAQLAGQVTDVINANRLMSLGEIGDPYKANTAIERVLKNGTSLASKWNGLVYWTDAIKSISSVMSQNRILEGVTGQADDTRFLAFLGIGKNNGMSGRIAEQFQQFGKTIDGVKIANTDAWTDKEAVRVFRAALSKDVDSIIVTRSVGDVPLFANTATGKMILQFRTFNIAAMQRVMMRGMQEEKAKFLSSIVTMSTLGMMAATFRSWRGGEERWEKFKNSAKNPGYLIGEGLDNSGIFTVPFEIANTAEKFMQGGGYDFNPIKKPLIAAFPSASQAGESTRFASRGVMGAVLGPTAGMVETATKALGGKKNAIEQMVPFGSYPVMREIIQAVTGDSPYLRR